MGTVYRKRSRGKDLGWYAVYVDGNGCRRHVATKQANKQEARVFLSEIEGRIRRGLVGVPEPEQAAQLTVGEVVERYLTEYSSPRIKNLANRMYQCRSVFKRLLPHLGTLLVVELTSSKLARVRDALLQQLAPNTVRVTLETLHSALLWAVREGITKTMPPKVSLPRIVEPVEYLDGDEVARLLAEAERRAATSLRHESRRVAVMLAVLAGLRRGEIFGLRWQDIDLGTGRLTIARSYRTTPKSGQARHLRLPPTLVPVLQEWRQRCPRTAEEVVVPVWSRRWQMGTVHGDFGLQRLLKLARCKPLRRGWHALRHTFASHFVMQGGSTLTLARILGHADLKMTLVYAHLSPDFLGQEMARLRFT